MNRPQYLTEKEVAKITSLSTSKLQSDRHANTGFNYFKIGSAVRYDLVEILKYMEEHRIVTR
ncbi:conserved protein of unknown function [Pseudodesulfovibrio profundus]|uniref:Helix-turn-helix domain-containing protein n=1 Tax=Pseudodesulfovibrio profundus TaxID=57320 RepID=A0A2C8FD60_9BACT|nr:helix-turn-helix domain-containing protein [Pseudodesulfovibrio profundus]SOB59993.1 conserved protein of unknown function [Pseudodesulfovibrio profundus]